MAKKIQEKERIEGQQQRLMEEKQSHAAALEKLKIKHEKKETATATMRSEIIKYKQEQASVIGIKASETLEKVKSKSKQDQASLLHEIKEREAKERVRREEKVTAERAKVDKFFAADLAMFQALSKK